MFRFVLALGVLAGCASPVALDASGPATAPPAPATVSLAALAPASHPTLPSALRAPDHLAAHGAMSHGAMPMESAARSAPLGAALDAYLALQESLAMDETDGLAEHARQFADAWALAIETAPETDPHFWHMRMEETAAVRTHAAELAEADGLAEARDAFGHLSAPFVALLETHGAPEGYDLSRFTCGMRNGLPEGGVWLQRGTEARNPYYGAAMLACATDEVAIPSRTGDLPAMGGMDHEAHGALTHAGHDG